MKNFSSLVTYFLPRYYILFLSLFIWLGISYTPIGTIIFTETSFFNKNSFCLAKTTLPDDNTDVASANTLSLNTLYESTLPAGLTQYYCLSGQERNCYIQITLKANEIPSFNFQLFDSSGSSCPPAAYQYQPSNHVLRLKYYFFANKNYLLSLSNLSSASNIYTLKYTTPSKPKDTAKPASSDSTNKKKNIIPSKPKATSKPKSPHPKYKKRNTTSSKPRVPARPTAKSIIKPTIKPTVKTEKIILSKTFIRISSGKTFVLKAAIKPRGSKNSCQWVISNPSFLSKAEKKNISFGSVFTAKAKKQGTIIISYKTTGKKQLSASCTVKII